MSNANDVRRAHDLVDELDARAELSQEQEKLLRSFLPERPKDATLDDLLTRVHAAWLSADPSDWGFDTPAEHHDWLFDLRNDLIRITKEQDAPANTPALPAGMRLADHEEYGRCVVSPNDDENNLSCRIFYVDEVYVTDSYSRYVETSSLTFIDAEPAKPAHPEFLETEADYRDAPLGTIVAQDDLFTAWTKTIEGWSSTDMGMPEDCPSTSYARRVLRWGKDK